MDVWYCQAHSGGKKNKLIQNAKGKNESSKIAPAHKELSAGVFTDICKYTKKKKKTVQAPKRTMAPN